MKKNILAKKIIVTGKVQGVGFRYFVKKKAEEIGVAGWVKNTEDGAVEIFAEAEGFKINLLVNYCEKGPSNSRVESVAVQEVTSCENKIFKIKI